jgi:hypothetical protein
MFRSTGSERQSGFDWLPWGLSVFGSGCAAFVLVAGVLPERTHNRELMQEVARLQTDLARTEENANTSLQEAKTQLLQQDLSAQARVNAAREQERARAAVDAARRDLSQSLAAEIKEGAVALEERGSELVIVASERLLFEGDRAALGASGRAFMRELAQSIRRLPAGQVYQLGGGSAPRLRSLSRFLEVALKVPAEQLAVRGASEAASATSAAAPRAGTIEVVLMRRKR